MYTILLPDQLKIVARVSTVDQAVLISELDYPDQATQIFPTDEKRHFSSLGRLDMMILLKNHGIEPAGIEHFAKMCEQAVTVANSLPLDSRSLFKLEQKAGPKPLPGDSRAIERKPFYQALSQPCEGADRPDKPARQPGADKAAGVAPTKGATARVWEIADSQLGNVELSSLNLKAFRTSVIEACTAEGLNPGTAATQFGKWKNTKGL